MRRLCCRISYGRQTTNLDNAFIMYGFYALHRNLFSEYKKEQAICYITALQWILDYYYRGVRSWGWYYPHHYAPFISDLKNFKDHVIKFDLGKPFLPFQQVNIKYTLH